MDNERQLVLRVADNNSQAPRQEVLPQPPSDMDNGGVAIGQIFNTRRPGHLGSGLVSGAGNVFKGVALGVSTLVAAPVVGGMSEGAKGVFKGLGIGVVAAVALPIAGVVTGFGQVGGGAVNTVQAVQEIGKGTVYNDETEKWEPKYRKLSEEYQEAKEEFEKWKLEKERRQPLSGPPSRDNKLSRPGIGVADMEYYDVLNVQCDASEVEIRKAYYKLARENHPDKRPGDEDAKAAFQRIGEAYQVLGNAATRTQYDRHGKAATEQVDFVDHALFFAILFGSEEMTPYVGNLLLGSLLANGEDSEKLDITLTSDSREQAWRVAQLAMNLRQFCQGAVEALKQKDNRAMREWTATQRGKAQSLCSQSFGWQMVDTIGFSYDNYASHFLAKDSFLQLGTARTKFKKAGREWTTLVAAMKAVKSANDVNKKARRAKKNSSPEDTARGVHSAESAQLMEEGMKHVLKVMLQICLHDVLSTVRNAAQKYINDRAVESRERKLRAEVVQDLGKIFIEAADAFKNSGNADIDLRDYMQDAYVKMAQKMDERGPP